MPALGIPVLVALCILLAAIGGSATNVNDIAQINAVTTAPSAG